MPFPFILSFILFVFGLIFGSFLNVLATRYDPDHFLLRSESLGGRSHCSYCGRTLRWFELIPLLSFILQAGYCRRCHAPLSWQYPVSELVSGLIVLGVPQLLWWMYYPLSVGHLILLSALWILAFFTLLLVALIDFHWKLIPDEATIFLAIIALVIAFVARAQFTLTSGSFLGPYSLIFGFHTSFIVNRLLAVVIAGGLFGLIFVLSRGRGMGFGDVKLSLALALLFGWPDVLVLAALAFILGGIFGVGALLSRRKTLKTAVPFGPFLVIAALLVFFWGQQIVHFYFSLFPGIG